MAATASESNEYEFLHSVPEYLYCKKCSLVAKTIAIVACCGESFCQACIADTQKQGQPCPECGEKEFTFFKHVKNQKQINGLQVCCNMKERGCVWSGTLDQLDAHLDPYLDNCQYVDTKCPLNCLQTVPKNKVEDHMAQECFKRPHVCQYCNFKASYEEVVDTHLPVCKLVILQCPNMCGVSCEREVIEDHLKICRLEEVECEFSSVGCGGRFIREDLDKHARQNSQKHMTLTASFAVKAKEQLQQNLFGQDKTYKEEVERLKEQLVEQREKVLEQEKMLLEQEKNSKELEEKLREQEKLVTSLKQIKMQSLDSKLKKFEHTLLKVVEKMNKLNRSVSHLSSIAVLDQKFEMKNFSIEKAKSQPDGWKSPAMYTHVGGYKFCVRVDANGRGCRSGNSVTLDALPLPVDYDSHLKWPLSIKFSIELINRNEGENVVLSKTYMWYKTTQDDSLDDELLFIPHSEVWKLLKNDSLIINISHIEFL